jgi:hypothetical protein
MKILTIFAVFQLALTLTECLISFDSLRPKQFKPTAIANAKGTGTGTGKGRNAKAQTKADKPSVCGEMMLNMKDGDHGYIESPHYPDPYKAGIECLWTLKVRNCTDLSLLRKSANNAKLI